MQFGDLARTFDAIERTSAQRELVALLADLFRGAGDAELQPLIYLCQGRLAPAFIPLEFGMAEKTIAEAIAQAYGSDRASVLQRYDALGDLGQVTAELRPAWRASESATDTTLEALAISTRLQVIAETNGSGSLAQD